MRRIAETVAERIGTVGQGTDRRWGRRTEWKAYCDAALELSNRTDPDDTLFDPLEAGTELALS